MTIKGFDSGTSELPFSLETRLERSIAADPEWLLGVEWGQPRPGHPEGKVVLHIRNVLHNIDRFCSNSKDRTKLRLIGLIHDTFKYKRVQTNSNSLLRQSHGYWARVFAERYINDVDILEVTELHDEAYKVFLLLSQTDSRETAQRQAIELIRRLDHNLDLFMQFYLCDSRTGDKSTAHYEWFRDQIEKYKGARCL